MNKIDQNPDYKQIYKFVSDKYSKTNHFGHGPFDETFYTLRVYETAKEIISLLKENIRVQQVLVACILHDIGKTKLIASKMFRGNNIMNSDEAYWEFKRHASLSVPIARRFLKQLRHSEEFIDEVSYLVENHNKRGDKMKERTLELKIIQDADLTADIGIEGFVRTFAYSGKNRAQSMIGSIRYIQKEDGTLDGNKINLDVSKKLYRREQDIQEKLAKEIYTKIDSDLF